MVWEAMDWKTHVRHLLSASLAIAVLALVATGCAPASSGGGGSSLDVGQPAPPFAMTLVDGSQVTSADLDADDQPAHLFWFATW